MEFNKKSNRIVRDVPSFGVSLFLVYPDGKKKFIEIQQDVPEYVQVNGISISWTLLEALTGGLGPKSWFRSKRENDSVTIQEMHLQEKKLRNFIRELKLGVYYNDRKDLREFVALVEEML